MPVLPVYIILPKAKDAKMQKTYNRRDSQMVTHSSTSRPVQCLCMAERTGCPVFTDLWSYVQMNALSTYIQYNYIPHVMRCSENETDARITI